MGCHGEPVDTERAEELLRERGLVIDAEAEAARVILRVATEEVAEEPWYTGDVPDEGSGLGEKGGAEAS